MKKFVHLALEAFRLFTYFASIAFISINEVNARWLGATYKFFTQALFTWVEKIPIEFISNGMRTIEASVMWFLNKFSFQELGTLVIAAIVSRLAVRLIIELDKLFHRARVMRKRRQAKQQQKAQQRVHEAAEARFCARNAVSMTDLGAIDNNPNE